MDTMGNKSAGYNSVQTRLKCDRFSLIADAKQAAVANFAVRHQTLAGRAEPRRNSAKLTGSAG